MKRAPFLLKAILTAALLAGLGAGAAFVAVKVFFPEPRARAWFVDAARHQLGRDVRLERIEIGPRGLDLHGLEVSERSGFGAGTFVRVEDFRLRPSWRALLKRRLVAAAVAADGLKVRVVEGPDGRFNYETLAASSSTPAEAPGSAARTAAPAPEMNVRSARAANGTIEYVDAAGTSWTLTGLSLAASDFKQGEPFDLETSFQLRGKAGSLPVDASVSFGGRVNLTREGFEAAVKRLAVEQKDLKLAGSGSVVFTAAGTKEKPGCAGKAEFKDLSGTAAGLPLAGFAGTLSFDANRVDLPNLSGNLAGGRLQMDFSVKNLARAPDVRLEASLDRFDLGRFLAAKKRIAAAPAEPAAEKSAPAAPAATGAPPASSTPEQKRMLVSTRGHLTVGTLIHPNGTVTDVMVNWDLRGVGADLRALSGDATLHVGGGRVSWAGDLASESKLVKVLLFPLLVVQKLGSLGGLRLFPDFNGVALRRIDGVYGFQNGLMTLRRSEMDSNAARVSAKGTIDLPAEALDLVVTAQVGGVAPIDVAVAGTFDKPKVKVNLAKAAQQLLQGLFGK